MSKVFIVAGKRTAIGSFLGTLKNTHPADLGAELIKKIIEDTKVDPKDIDEVVIGNILPAGLGQGVGRQVAVKGGLPHSVPGYSLNIACGSGMKAIMNAYSNVNLGIHNLVLAGGVESMSKAPYIIPEAMRNGHKMGEFKVADHMIHDALEDAFDGIHMGITAENIARKYNVSRNEQDAFAYESQRKAIAAVDSGRFKDEIVPFIIQDKKGITTFDTDEYPNRTTNMEKLAKLRPAFEKEGSVTAGNSAGLNDGASMVLIANEKAVKKYNLKPMVEIIGIGQGGVDPTIMGLGPTPSIEKALNHAKLKLTDISLIELNEAFAAQSLGVLHELTEAHHVSKEWLLERTNVNGGAIALGHPVGSSGNRIVVTLMHEMIKRNVEYGLASLCIGGGMGTALVVERV